MNPAFWLIALLVMGTPAAAHDAAEWPESQPASGGLSIPMPPPLPERLARVIRDAAEVRAFLLLPEGRGSPRPVSGIMTEAEVIGVARGWLVREEAPELSARQVGELKSLLVERASYWWGPLGTVVEPLVGYLFATGRDTLLAVVSSGCAQAQYQLAAEQGDSSTAVRVLFPAAVSLARLTQEIFPTDSAVRRTCEEAKRFTESYEEVRRSFNK